MRNADLATLLRIALIVVVAYLVIIKFNPIFSIALFAIALILDAVDGFFAVSEASSGKIGLSKYISSALGDSKLRKVVKEAKLRSGKIAPYGPRLDILGDRITEYSFWALFLYLHVVPLFVMLVVIIRHSFVDGFMGMKGTSSKMKTSIASVLYASNASRALANILKFAAFSYLILEYVFGYPSIVGNALVGILVLFIVARGVAEIYESFA
jgi:phosphatidylglycerophosphate synthase